MSRREKAIARWGNNPKSVRFEDVDALLLHLGFTKRQGGTSHAVYTLGAYRITIPYRRPFIREAYVKSLLQLLDEMDQSED